MKIEDDGKKDLTVTVKDEKTSTAYTLTPKEQETVYNMSDIVPAAPAKKK